MEYFRLRQDERQPYGIIFKGFHDIPNAMEAVKGNANLLDDMTVVFVTSSKYNWYPAVLSRQLFMYKESVKQTVDIYCPNLEYRHFCILDKKNRIYEYYYIPILEAFNCMSESSEYNLDKSIIKKIVLKREVLPEASVFRLGEVKDQVVIVTLAVAESLIRRNIDGIQLQRVWLD